MSESARDDVLDAWHRLVQAGYRLRFEAKRDGKFSWAGFEALEEELARLTGDVGKFAETIKNFRAGGA